MLHEIIPLWDTPPENGRLVPALETFVTKGISETRPAVLICPGGAYAFLNEREADPVAMAFAARGFQAFVLHYSVEPCAFPQQLCDISRAMCIIRERAAEWKVDPKKIAVAGFSAGGHLAASLGVYYDLPELADITGMEQGKNRPDALVLCYPVISLEGNANARTVKNITGGKDLKRKLSLQYHVNKNTPPAFLWHTRRDSAVPWRDSLMFFEALDREGVECELHIYNTGEHGLSLATTVSNTPDFTDSGVAAWVDAAEKWLRRIFKEEQHG